MQTDAACETSSFFVWTQIPNCSPITIPKRPSKATMGGAGLFTRIRPYKIPTPRPTTKDKSKTLIAYLLPKSGWKSRRIEANVTSRKGASFASALELERCGPNDDFADFDLAWLLDGVSDRACDRVGRNRYLVELAQIFSGGFLRAAFR